MYLFFIFTNNIYMWKKILNLYNKINLINHTYKIPLLASSNTFYMILLIIPLNNMGFKISNMKIINILDIYKWGILFLVNLVFVGTRYLENLKNSSDVIYQTNIIYKRNYYFKSLLLMITLVVVITTLVIISYGLIDIWNNVINTKHYWYIKIMELIVSFSIIMLVVAMVYKYSIPIKISFKKTLKISLILSIVWLIMSTIYQNIINFLYFIKYEKEYLVIISIYFMYIINYIFVSSIFYNYWQMNYELKTTNEEKI